MLYGSNIFLVLNNRYTQNMVFFLIGKTIDVNCWLYVNFILKRRNGQTVCFEGETLQVSRWFTALCAVYKTARGKSECRIRQCRQKCYKYRH